MKILSLLVTSFCLITQITYADGEYVAGFKLECFSELNIEMPHQGKLSKNLVSFFSTYRGANVFSGPVTMTHDEQAHVLKMTLIKSYIVKDSSNPSTAYSTYKGVDLIVMKNDLKEVLRLWKTQNNVSERSKLVSLNHIGCTTQPITFNAPRSKYTFQ